MGTLIDVDDDTKEEDEEEEQQLLIVTSSFSSPQPHQLIGVDGSLIPAVDDDGMDVDQLLQNDIENTKQQQQQHSSFQPNQPSITTTRMTTNRNEDIKLGLEGDVKLDITDNAKVLNACLQVDKVQLSDESLDNSLKCTAADICAPRSCINSNECSDKHLIHDFSRENATGSLLLNDGLNALTKSAEMTPGPRNETVTDSTSVSEICTSSMPDFSILKGEICLDNLSIRALQEAFRATFGRHTTVKDKLWLKRRISMGLVNSYDIPTTSFVIKNNKIIYKDIKEEAPCRFSALKHEVDSLVKYEISDLPSACSENLITSTTNQLTHKQLTESTSPHSEDCQMEQFSAKRMRKPTRRYIEELSDPETRECSAKVSGEDKSSRKYQTGFLGDVGKRKSFSIRYDSFGGFGILIPYASRVRTGRPRKNIMDLMKYHPSGKSSDIIETDSPSVLQQELESGSYLPVCLLQPSFLNKEKAKMDSQKILCKNEPYMENKGPDAYGDNRDDNVDSQSLVKTEAKRKHHRAWTLCEIQKLVEGVAIYGAGRWSEIRRLAFTSYSYRTSVDLKDKWRNLLRASLAQGPAGKGAGNFRKHTSILIPSAVLSRVRELAELNGQAGIQLRPSHGGKAAKGTGSGFL